MADPSPTYKFELNCFMTQAGTGLNQLQFKELKIVTSSPVNYRTLREFLERGSSIWYAHENYIYLVGDEREVRECLKENGVETGQARLASYGEMLAKRESILRFLLYSGLDQLMRQRGFLPSISTSGHSYYPSFEKRNETKVTDQMKNSNFTVITKNGMVFDIDLSPDGPALLWIDGKLFTFIHTSDDSLEDGDPVYLLCNQSPNCDLGEFRYLLDGAFVTDDDDKEKLLPACVLNKSNIVRVRSKTGRMLIVVPRDCIHTMADTSTLKELGVYNWWRAKAIPTSEERYKISKSLVNMISEDPNVLAIPFPDNQSLVFNLQPIVRPVQMRFAS